MRLDHLLSKEHHQLWWPSACPRVVRVVAHGWNINGWALGRAGLAASTPLLGVGKLSAGAGGVSGGDTLLGFEAARSSWPLSLVFWFVPSGRVGVSGVGVWVCGWSSLCMIGRCLVVCGVGLFLENCIVDASIFVSN